jgi:hydrogenase maturation factor
LNAVIRGGTTLQCLNFSRDCATVAPDGKKCMPVEGACQVLNRFNRNKSKAIEI